MIDKKQGWFRLGVVLSFLWIFCWSFAGVINAARFNQQSVEEVTREHYSCIKIRSKSIEDCGKEFQTNMMLRSGKNLIEEASTYAFISLIFIPFFWLSGAVAIVSARWIREGFR